jgi:hypothetical protein
MENKKTRQMRAVAPILLCLSILASCEALLPGEGTVPPQGGGTVPEGQLDALSIKLAGAFADEKGQTLLARDVMLDKERYSEEEKASYHTAAGPGGELIPIEYLRDQESTGMGTGRDNADNFSNLPGALYQAKEGSPFLTNQSYFLLPDSLLSSAVPLLAPDGDEPPLSQPVLDKASEAKGRAVRWSKKLASTAGGAEIGVILYERLGDEMLYSIVYAKGGSVLFNDNPAAYDKYSTWHVDAGDEPGFFEAVLLIESEGGVYLALTDASPEGVSLFALAQDGPDAMRAAEEETYLRYTSQ